MVMLDYRWVIIWMIYLEWVDYGRWMDGIFRIYKYMLSIILFFATY